MALTEEQAKAVEMAKRMYHNKDKYIVISGYAGTGKSFTIRYLIDALQIPESAVVFTAFTGKACEVMKKKGNKNVSTLHKLLFKSYLKADGTYARQVVDYIDYKIVVVDECSMVPMQFREILENMPDIFIIYLGDDAQLPPIKKEDDNHLLDAPNAKLTQIMRQAEGNDIIDIATAIRQGERLNYYNGKDAKILRKSELNEGMLLWADIIICATNRTRAFLNKEVRRIKGYKGDIVEGEKIICLRNNWDIITPVEKVPLINGMIGYAHNISEGGVSFPRYLGGRIDTFNLEVETESREYFNPISIDKQCFLTNTPALTPQMKYKVLHNKEWRGYLPEEMTYGYAITCWKAQGSQWDKVLLYEEDFPYEEELRQRFLYTAVTRAADKLVILR